MAKQKPPKGTKGLKEKREAPPPPETLEILSGLLAARRSARESGEPGERAAQRHDAWLSRSEAYREAWTAADDPTSFDEADAAGVHWVVPRGTPERDKFAQDILAGNVGLKEINAARQFATGRVMLDIGANVGATSIPRIILGDFELVYAAEPEPRNYGALVRAIRTNGLAGHVLPDRVALGVAEGMAPLAVSGRIGTHELRATEVPGETVTTVPVRTLDSWVSELGIDPNDIGFVKTDCQGWDGQILRGARRLLGYRHIAWQIEFWPPGLRRAHDDPYQLCAFIAQHFTHAMAMKGPWWRGVVPTSELIAGLKSVEDTRNKFAELVLFNLGGRNPEPERRALRHQAGEESAVPA